MKYLNRHAAELFAGKKLEYRGKVYWASIVNREVYAQSVDEKILGGIIGYKVANINDDWEIVKC